MCTDDFCASGACTHPDKCPGQNCCPNGECCDTACEECLDNGSLSGGTIAVDPAPACVGDTISFTIVGVTDDGAIKRVDCSAKTFIPPGTISYEWTITKPDGTVVTDSGLSATVLADQPGTYSGTVTASTARECPPPNLTIGPGAVEAADVVMVVWEPVVGNDGLGTDPNNGGKRIFPGKRSPGDGAAAQRRQVTLKATIDPVVQGGCTVYFKTWDVDDPFDQNNPGRPNVQVIDGNTSGPDNDGGSGSLSAASDDTDANGEVEVTFTVSMQPGDNFRAGASVVDTALSGTTQVQADANAPPQDVLFTDMLTLWRKLHVELDSMGPVTGNEIAGPFTDIVGIGTALTEVTGTGSLDDGSKDLDDAPPENGRFENGTLIIGTTPSTITIAPITGNGNNRVVFPQASIAGLPFYAEDSDFVFPETMSGTITEVVKSGGVFVWTLSVTASSESPIDWPGFEGGKLTVGGGAEVTIEAVSGGTQMVATSTLNIPCVVRDDDDNSLLPRLPNIGTMAAAYKDAYVVPVYDVGDTNFNVPFRLNVEDADIVSAQDWDSRSLNTTDFWAAYVMTSFQYATIEDGDPDSEGGPFGVTSNPTGGSLIFLEVHQAHEGTSDPLAEEQDTVVHETGHAVGHIPRSGEPVTIPSQPSTFLSNSLELIRTSPKPWS